MILILFFLERDCFNHDEQGLAQDKRDFEGRCDVEQCLAEMVSAAELLSVNDSWRNLFLLIGAGEMPGYSDKELTGNQPCSNAFQFI